MATQNAYTPEVVQLQGGLDVTSPRPTVAPGALIDCYNFEVSDLLGYTRVSGVEPFDGRKSISTAYTELYRATTTSDLTGLTTPSPMVRIGDTTEETFGIITQYDIPTNSLQFYITNFPKFFAFYSDLHANANARCSPDGTATNELILIALANANIYNTSVLSLLDTVSDSITNSVAQYSNAFNHVEPLGTTNWATSTTYNPAIGLQWFKNQLYAICDLNSFTFSNGNVAQPAIGDILHNTTQNTFIVIRDISVTTGVWNNGNAQGKITYSLQFPSGSNLGPYNSATFGTAASGHVIVNGDQFTLVRNGTTIANILQANNSITGTKPTAFAGMFRGWDITDLPAGSSITKQGWQELDLGYSISYSKGTASGPPHKVGRDSSPPPSSISPSATQLATIVTSAFPGSPGFMVSSFTAPPWTFNYWVYTGATPVASLAAPNDNKYIIGASAAATAGIACSGFTFPDVPSDALITGFEVDVYGFGLFQTGGSPGMSSASVTMAYTGSQIKTTGQFTQVTDTIPPANPAPTGLTAFTLGSPQDLWGTSGLTAADLPNMNLTVRGLLTGSMWACIDSIQVRVYYQTTSSIYYFWDGTDDVQATLTSFQVSSGDWTTADAAGDMQIANVVPVGSAARNAVQGSDIIHTVPGATSGVPNGAIIATVQSNMLYSGLPSLNMLQTNNSQYEMITANFFGNTDWEAIYGVSGTGRAFTYDGFYFRDIYTGLSNTLDIPRHVAFHNFHLCLGYEVGSLLTSVTGDPENFSGVDGAGEFDTADAITGLLRMNGTTLGVYCKKSIQGLNGTDNTNFSINILSPYEGAIEYTVVDCGQPVYASHKGISTFDQTSSYGSFLGARLSSTVTPWLLPRLTSIDQTILVRQNVAPITLTPSQVDTGVLFAMPIRDKNQYRLYFKDGYYLTLTFYGADATGTFTIQQVDFSTNGTDYLVPLGHSSSIDDDGLERNHVSYYDPIRGLSSTKTDNKNYVWEINRGWGFGKSPIKSWFTTTHNFFDNPFQTANPRKIRLHGQSHGIGTLSVAVSADYLSNDFMFGNIYGQVESNAPYQDISLPRAGGAKKSETLSFDLQPKTAIADVAKTGRSFSMQFASNPSVIEPPFVAQALLIQTTENKADV